MDMKEEARKQIVLLENSRKLLLERLDINNQLTNAMVNHPNKLKPDYAFETDKAYIEAVKKKWLNENALEAVKIRSNIKQIDSQIDLYKKQSVQNKPVEKVVDKQTKDVIIKPTISKKNDKKSKKGGKNE